METLNQMRCENCQRDCIVCKFKKMSHWAFVGIDRENINIENRLELILNEVCCRTGTDKEDITSKCRKLKYVLPRQIYCYVARKTTNATLQQIGNIVNIRHDSVLNAVKNIKNQIEVRDKKTMIYYDKIKYMVSECD